MIYHHNYNCYNVNQQPAVNEVSNIIFSRSSISVLVVLIFSKNNFMIVPFFDFGFSRYCKIVKSWNDLLQNVAKFHDQTLNYLPIQPILCSNLFQRNFRKLKFLRRFDITSFVL